MMFEADDHRPAIAQAIFPPDQDVSRIDCRISYACNEPLVEAADGDRDMTCALKMSAPFPGQISPAAVSDQAQGKRRQLVAKACSHGIRRADVNSGDCRWCPVHLSDAHHDDLARRYAMHLAMHARRRRSSRRHHPSSRHHGRAKHFDRTRAKPSIVNGFAS